MEAGQGGGGGLVGSAKVWGGGGTCDERIACGGDGRTPTRGEQTSAASVVGPPLRFKSLLSAKKKAIKVGQKGAGGAAGELDTDQALLLTHFAMQSSVDDEEEDTEADAGGGGGGGSTSDGEKFRVSTDSGGDSGDSSSRSLSPADTPLEEVGREVDDDDAPEAAARTTMVVDNTGSSLLIAASAVANKMQQRIEAAGDRGPADCLSSDEDHDAELDQYGQHTSSSSSSSSSTGSGQPEHSNNHALKGLSTWSPAEDALLIQLVKKHGTKKWALIADRIPGRKGKACRERFRNQLDPAIKKTPWTEEEDARLMAEQACRGNKWVEIARYLPGRSENAVKNRWNSLSNSANLARQRTFDGSLRYLPSSRQYSDGEGGRSGGAAGKATSHHGPGTGGGMGGPNSYQQDFVELMRGPRLMDLTRQFIAAEQGGQLTPPVAAGNESSDNTEEEAPQLSAAQPTTVDGKRARPNDLDENGTLESDGGRKSPAKSVKHAC